MPDPPEWRAWLASLPRFPPEPDPARMDGFLARLGSPQNAFDAVHVVGTNGKGSVCALVEAAAREQGLRTGLFTSPHLHRWGERVRVAGEAIQDDALGALLDEVRERTTAATALGPSPVMTAFDALTCAAFAHFARERVDLAIVEAGVGGRLDSTNALPRTRAAALTSVGTDHAGVLGPTREAVAREKLAIARVGAVLVAGERDPGLLPLLEARANREGARLRVLGRDVEAVRTSESLEGQTLDLRSGERTHRGVRLALLGDHQAGNAAVALALSEAIGIGEAAIRLGFPTARWPARLEVASGPLGATWLVDAAHNPEGVDAVAPTIRRLASGGHVVAVVGVSGERDPVAMARALAPVADAFVVTAPRSRGLAPRRLAEALARAAPRSAITLATDAADAVREAGRARADLSVALGSAYLAAEVREALRLPGSGA